MKRIQYLFALAVFISTATSCSSYLDDIKPRHAIEQSSLTESDMEKVLTSVYAKMEEYTFKLWWNDDIQGENFATGNAQTKMPDPCNMNPSGVNTNISVLSYWRQSYSALNQVNFLIESYENSSNKSSETMKEIARAVYYFRAFIYYRLASHFGNVPILYQRTEDVIPLSSESDVWKFIEEDLERARTFASDATSNWYVTKDAINALSARVALFQNKADDAAKYAEEVLKNTQYALVNTADGFSSIFLPESSSKEIVFGYVNNTRSSGTLKFYETVNDTDGSFSYSADEDLQATLFEDDAATKRFNDIRHWATFIQAPKESIDKARIIKFSNGVSGQELAHSNDPEHTPVIVSRIAEMYLVKAEALGKNAGASTLRTFLISRYDDDVMSENEIKALSDEDYQSLILDERRREFYAEGMRWQDVKRTKRYDLLQTLNGRTYLMYYPIPQEEVDIAGKKNYPQNPGY